MESTVVVWTVVSLLVFSSLTSAVRAPKRRREEYPLSCRDEQNKDVDWYILYKAPNSWDYIYIDSNTLTTADRVRRLTNIRDENGVLVNTLRPMFGSRASCSDTPSSFGFLSYSDQPPRSGKPGQSSGHSKGVVLGDSGTGAALWLTHSTPGFPKSNSPKMFCPESAKVKGQTFMCVSLDYSQLQTVGRHLHHIRAHVFDRYIPGHFPAELRFSVLGKTLSLTTRGGKELRVMSKSSGETAADGDLYVQLTQAFESDVFAQTYGSQAGRDGSYCVPNQPKVISVESINVLKRTNWHTNCDHSKWAVTNNNNRPWTCISDMNRARTQYLRPGGALCIKDEAVNSLFRGFVAEPLQCGVSPKQSTECPETL